MKNTATSQVNKQYPDNVRLLTFKIDDQLFGIDVFNVRDIFCADKITPVPLSNPEINGLINLRGRIVTSISLRKILGFSEKQNSDITPMNIAVEHEGDVYSLLIDQVSDVKRLTQGSFEKKVPAFDGPLKEYTEGLYKLKKDLLIALDIHKIIKNCK